ncbi:MAG: mandelate racemase/muconate lactonizing enzyme family protein [Burkholderiaceae bacterium]|nr:mandelate racemase/muconate lactonizing enzyme family protein [Burkholderiaceae bacterium]
MKIVGLETVQVEEYGNLVWVLLHTDEGLVGLGETFRNPEATVAYVHETCAPHLIGKDPLCREARMHELATKVGNHFNGFPTRSVEVRGNSAIDLALWDLDGKHLGVPLYRLLGGRTRDRVRIYNTCAGGQYNNKLRHNYNTELVSRDVRAPATIGRYEDLLLQVYEPAQLAQELLAEGITAMKIWPFDVFALRNEGADISARELSAGLWPIEQIRAAVGDRIDILIEYHGLWRLPAALKIADALREHDIYWHEEPIGMQNFDDLARYRERVRGRVAGSENLGTVPWYREVFTRGALDVAHFDLGWIGGLSEGQRITHLAAAFDRCIAPHDCTGPVTLIANVHMLVAAPNGLIAETVRSHTHGFYRQIVNELPLIESGFVHPLERPGLGTELSPVLFARSDTRLRLSGERTAERMSA